MSAQRDKHTAFQAMLKYAAIGLCKPEMPMSPHVEIKPPIYTKKLATLSFTFLRSGSHKVKSKRRMAGRNTGNPRYVVLIGDVGTGKSTIVEKLTNERGRASDKDTSVTKSSEVFWTTDGSIVISDTPGSNAMEDKLEHNVWIASALNFRPVSKIFIMAKAETRLDNVVDNVRKYTDRFVELDPNALGILITHMDTVTWTPTRCSAMINNELGIESVVFSQMNTAPGSLIQDIHGVCRGTYELGVDGDNFLKLFKLNNSNSKILMITAKEVEAFRDLKEIFNMQINAFNHKDKVDLVFEFQAYMEQQIVVAQQSMSQQANFTFMGDNSANEAGHVANMTNQLRAILHSIRIQALGYHSDHGVNDLRQCPHCGLKWAKVGFRQQLKMYGEYAVYRLKAVRAIQLAATVLKAGTT